MKKGELALIKVSGDYAKGHPTAPADAALHYEVELLDFTKEKASWEMTNEEKLAAAQKNKDDGNELFKAGKFRGAIKKYKVRSRLPLSSCFTSQWRGFIVLTRLLTHWSSHFLESVVVRGQRELVHRGGEGAGEAAQDHRPPQHRRVQPQAEGLQGLHRKLRQGALSSPSPSFPINTLVVNEGSA
jgi:hypothetical protein